MPLLGALLAGLFASIVKFIAAYFAVRLVIRLAILAGVVAVIISFVDDVQTVINGITNIAIPSEIQIAASWVMPSNLILCINLILGAYVSRFIFDWTVKLMLGKSI